MMASFSGGIIVMSCPAVKRYMTDDTTTCVRLLRTSTRKDSHVHVLIRRPTRTFTSYGRTKFKQRFIFAANFAANFGVSNLAAKLAAWFCPHVKMFAANLAAMTSLQRS